MKRTRRTLHHHIFGLFFVTSVLYTLSIASALLLFASLASHLLFKPAERGHFLLFQFVYIRYPREQPKEKRDERRGLVHLAFGF
jgi:hypothetical protein